ncbi:DHH family phosphoesterase [Haloprofundus salinisoli]|uniref:DHH family phosphoesterase n=1 Tax=Haloprofundus salinisoli TaxID=2876193 RepID=UPI001CCDCA88|nr:bifunctional oligoribonuclease/PAP phosphatase NrnA [Haloprofundus salinisoli]
MPSRVAATEALSDAEVFVRDNPEIATVLAVGLVALFGVSYALRWFRRPMGVQFKRALSDLDEIAVLMHPNPDPDAMAAAIGVACLADQVDTQARIQFTGQIRHQENRAFRTVLDLDLEQIDHVSEIAAENVVLVDHNTPRGFAGAESVLPFAVVDHHPGDGAGEEFTDVRTNYGACASIVAEYFRDIGAKPVPPDQHASEINARYTMPSTVATGLLYGILADTKRLTSGCVAADFTASGYLYPGVDEDLLDRIANPQVGAEVLEVKARAIAGRKVQGSFAVSDVGPVSNVDSIPQAADELMHLEGVTAVVVCGERDGTVYLSGRSRDDRVHMGRALEAAVADIPSASAGGHARMGGGQIPQVDPTGGDVPTPVPRNGLVDRLFQTLTGDV